MSHQCEFMLANKAVNHCGARWQHAKLAKSKNIPNAA